MTSNPTFSPGDVAWHVRHGKVTLLDHVYNTTYPVHDELYDCYTACGRVDVGDKYRTLYTLSEAEQFGWYKPEPRVVEFDAVVERDFTLGMVSSARIQDLLGKRVRVTVTEVLE